MAVPKQRNYQQILRVYKQPIAEMVEIVLEEVRVALPSLSHHAEWAFDTLQDYSLRDSKRVAGLPQRLRYMMMPAERHCQRQGYDWARRLSWFKIIC